MDWPVACVLVSCNRHSRFSPDLARADCSHDACRVAHRSAGRQLHSGTAREGLTLMHCAEANRSDVENSSADNEIAEAGGQAAETAAAAGSVATEPSTSTLPWLTGPVFLGSKSATRRSEAVFLGRPLGSAIPARRVM